MHANGEPLELHSGSLVISFPVIFISLFLPGMCTVKCIMIYVACADMICIIGCASDFLLWQRMRTLGWAALLLS
jgi:hypothetical protein